MRPSAVQQDPLVVFPGPPHVLQLHQPSSSKHHRYLAKRVQSLRHPTWLLLERPPTLDCDSAKKCPHSCGYLLRTPVSLPHPSSASACPSSVAPVRSSHYSVRSPISVWTRPPCVACHSRGTQRSGEGTKEEYSVSLTFCLGSFKGRSKPVTKYYSPVYYPLSNICRSHKTCDRLTSNNRPYGDQRKLTVR